ncbi:MAG: hypothetical protein OXF79_20900 [Chloroflexi bacterium]|nr:hypothetical protein [Chloroflexota bacterium]
MLGEDSIPVLAPAFLLLFAGWTVILPLTFGPAILTAAICFFWKRLTVLAWLLVSFLGGTSGVMLMAIWYFATVSLEPSQKSLVPYLLVPVPTAAITWALCAICRRSRFLVRRP